MTLKMELPRRRGGHRLAAGGHGRLLYNGLKERKYTTFLFGAITRPSCRGITFLSFSPFNRERNGELLKRGQLSKLSATKIYEVFIDFSCRQFCELSSLQQFAAGLTRLPRVRHGPWAHAAHDTHRINSSMFARRSPDVYPSFAFFPARCETCSLRNAVPPPPISALSLRSYGVR